QRFPGARGSGDEYVLPGANDGPTAELWLGRRSEAFKPFLDEGIECGKHYFQFDIRRARSPRFATPSTPSQVGHTDANFRSSSSIVVSYPCSCGAELWGNKGYTPEFVEGLLQETARG